MLQHENFIEFKFDSKSNYIQPTPNKSQHPFNKKPIKRFTSQSNLCPSCGLYRSRSNKCDCNS